LHQDEQIFCNNLVQAAEKKAGSSYTKKNCAATKITGWLRLIESTQSAAYGSGDVVY